MGVSHNKGTLNWGPYNKDPTIWGTILGSPIFGNPPYRVCRSRVEVFGRFGGFRVFGRCEQPGN